MTRISVVLALGWAALALGTGGCSNDASSGPSFPVEAVPDADVFGDGGVVLGDPCFGDVYVAGTTGFAACVNGVWVYISSVPCEFCPFLGSDAGDDGGVDAGPLDATTPPG